MLFGNGSRRARPRSSPWTIQYRKTELGYAASEIEEPEYPQHPGPFLEHEDYGLIFSIEGHLHYRNPANPSEYEKDRKVPARWIDSLETDFQDNLWLASWFSGLHRFDGNSWINYTTADGLASEEAMYVLNGKFNPGLWVATRKGLSRYDGKSWTTHALHPSFEFLQNSGSLAEARTGELWMNFSNENWLLNTKSSNNEVQELHRCTRYIADGQEPDTTIVSYDRELSGPANAYFSWKGRDAWDDTPEEDLEYSYRLSGGEWSPFSPSTEATLRDLSSGDYTIEVRARDRDWNVDPNPAIATFKVIPPLWKRPWYIALVAFTLLAFVAFIVVIVRLRLQQAVAMREFKLDFFTNLSHELRTPLTAILGPLESSLARAKDPQEKKELNMISRNANKMLGLINQLLEFRKVELGMPRQTPQDGEIIGFIFDSVHSLSSIWEKKEQTVDIDSNLKSHRCSFYPDELSRIIDNLLSNAIKYTPNCGRLSVTVNIEAETDNHHLYLKISDNGIGIPSDKLMQVLDPFYRLPSTDERETGSGIGLALVKDLVHFWGGTIELNSSTSGSNRGTKVELALPLIAAASSPPADDKNRSTDRAEIPSERSEVPRILIVEDDEDLRSFLRDRLSKKYDVSVAANGRQGMDTLARSSHHLILSDVMMPEMDGIDFCRAVRENQEICHIPIILLTARSADEHYAEGIENGADEYFTKPVKMSKLIARIENLLKSRRQLRDLFSKKLQIEPQEIAVASLDQEFLTKAIKIVEEHMGATDFDVDNFARKMATSRSTLNRKTKAITDCSPAEFIRSMRLKRSAQLLISTNVAVGEIITHCGFPDASSFSRSFKNEFGLSPGRYRSEKRRSETDKL
ncbi:MAG: ATP-binding protein, partial [Verrucomicrobiota bacterium]